MSAKNYEVAVIGGGIVGCSVAFYLAESGLDVILIEKNDIASGTSSRCDGNVSIVDKDPGFDSHMSWVSQELIEDLSKRLDRPFEYRKSGSILVCDNDDEMQAAVDWVKTQNEAGLKFNVLDRNDIKSESPFFADDIPGGLECETDSLINPYMFCYALVDKAESEYGLQVKTRAEVTNITKEGREFKIQTTNEDVRAQKIVNAAGVWAPFIGKMLDVDIPITPRKGHILVGSRQQPVMMRNVMEFGYLMNKFGRERIADKRTTEHGVALVLEPTESQNFLLGSSRQFVGYDPTIDIRVVETMARRALRFFPKMNDFKIIRAYTGFRPFTEDHLPIISEVKEVPGFYIAAGHEGDGISLATGTAKLMEEIINEKTETIIPKEPLSFDRFKKSEVYA
ncbi:NAD(P)/FAD-dependent oxidoreductase [Ornithinibacillus halotolerans]|uniref:Aerobic glycerol-3-phosphate dehydrogenase n=1 Tax=Ornithinibacillus halotolerans TaxID=1274357 RepID=A0A916RWM7_9BACI|nr:FAD-dependent oxidoreductase [Ornithinibacillus halotolerans]GGA74284.1 glycine oxidase [Ornithinibacillus halotolerans]